MTATLTVSALVPAAAGLIVAVPAVSIYNYLQGRFEALDTEMRIAALEATSHLASQPRLLNADEAQRESSGEPPSRLIRKFALQRPFSELLALPLAAVFGLAVVAFTVVANPYTAKGLHVRLLKPGEIPVQTPSAENLTIRVLKENVAGSRTVYVNAKKTQLNGLEDILRSESRVAAKATAYVQAEDNVPWGDVANAVDIAEELRANVVLLTLPPRH